jgi:hypothetical protein
LVLWLVILVKRAMLVKMMNFIARFCMQSEYGTFLQNET